MKHMTQSPADQVAHIGMYESVADILTVFRPVMRAMAAAAGPGCEVVLHDLSHPDPDLGHTIVAIENGHVTRNLSTLLGHVGLVHWIGLVSSSGRLIQAASGRFDGTGGLRTNRCGVAV